MSIIRLETNVTGKTSYQIEVMFIVLLYLSIKPDIKLFMSLCLWVKKHAEMQADITLLIQRMATISE
jgi:hypothetical protein